ncbi:MAG: DUF5131 family protein [Chloroflexi bacterium]|nr:DUF5131 family protein [Chloroflexota bacterium]
MSDKSSIEWTEATWNPVTGCTVVSPGCAHCYAKTFAERFRGVPGHPYEMGFDLTLRPERLEQPLQWTRPRTIFVNSMSDLFHEGVPLDYIRQIFNVMKAADWHTFQILTKRSERMAELEAESHPVVAERPRHGSHRNRETVIHLHSVDFVGKTGCQLPVVPASDPDRASETERSVDESRQPFLPGHREYLVHRSVGRRDPTIRWNTPPGRRSSHPCNLARSWPTRLDGRRTASGISPTCRNRPCRACCIFPAEPRIWRSRRSRPLPPGCCRR